MLFFTNKKEDADNVFDILLNKSNKTDYIYTIAEAHAIDLIAKTIAKCELQVFSKNSKSKKIEKTKDEIYWALNIQPNYYENGTSFIYKLVVKLLTNKKALVLIHKDMRGNPILYIADDFVVSDSLLYGKVFSNVTISDDEGNSLDMIKRYDSSNSIYFSIMNDNLKSASDNFKTNMSKLLDTAIKSYKRSNTAKWRLKNPGGQPKIRDAETGEEIDYSKYKEKLTNGLISEDEAIILLSQIFDLENLNKDIGSKDLNDIDKGIKQITDTAARNWNIPLDIFYGSKTEKSTGTDDFITFAVDMYFKLLEDGFNIGLVGQRDYLQGEYIKFNKHNITHRDILDSTTGMDKLMSNGFSRNEINELLELPKIDETWADKHYVTKNYSNVEGGVEDNGE